MLRCVCEGALTIQATVGRFEAPDESFINRHAIARGDGYRNVTEPVR